jgi:hypothetical protein
MSKPNLNEHAKNTFFRFADFLTQHFLFQSIGNS